MTKILAPRSISNRYRVLSSAAEIIHSFEQRNISGSSRAYPFVYSSLISRSSRHRENAKGANVTVENREFYLFSWVTYIRATCLTLCSIYYFLLLAETSVELRSLESGEKNFTYYLNEGRNSVLAKVSDPNLINL